MNAECDGCINEVMKLKSSGEIEVVNAVIAAGWVVAAVSVVHETYSLVTPLVMVESRDATGGGFVNGDGTHSGGSFT